MNPTVVAPAQGSLLAALADVASGTIELASASIATPSDAERRRARHVLGARPVPLGVLPGVDPIISPFLMVR
jgi:hypothetical protein